MKYHQEKGKVTKYEDKVKSTENKITKGTEQLQRQKEKLNTNMEAATKVKTELEQKQSEAEQFLVPVNETKKRMADLDKERKNANRAASSKQRFVDQSKEK